MPYSNQRLVLMPAIAGIFYTAIKATSLHTCFIAVDAAAYCAGAYPKISCSRFKK
jgi:hypothetical protein